MVVYLSIHNLFLLLLLWWSYGIQHSLGFIAVNFFVGLYCRKNQHLAPVDREIYQVLSRGHQEDSYASSVLVSG